MNLNSYNFIEQGGLGFKKLSRGLIKVWGKEAIQFLNGLITNDVAKLEEGATMLAAFPNAQGRLLAVVRVKRLDDAFLFETEGVTAEKVLKNLSRFTFAGDFFVEDLSEKYVFFTFFGEFPSEFKSEQIRFGNDAFFPQEKLEEVLKSLSQATEISDELYEVLRIEKGIPLYGIEMDETTIVPEIGLAELISYNKGCYIGQEIIARIHFRGHVAKILRGLIFDGDQIKSGDELKSAEGKNAGRITSLCFSPKLNKHIALGYVRYDYREAETVLSVNEISATVKNLPFF